MKIPVSWLEKYIKLDGLDITQLAHLMTMAGTEVSSVEHIGESWDSEHLVVGEIVDIKPHPNADKLRLPTIKISESEHHTVVCGAPNLYVSQKIVFAKEGAKLFNPRSNNHEVLKSAKIRGIESSGMVCSSLELGLGEDHSGILELNSDIPIGTPVKDFLSDIVIETELTPNRPDCLSIIGTAHEIAAITNQDVAYPETTFTTSNKKIEDFIDIDILDSDLCPRYMGTVIQNVHIQESPDWLKDALIKTGHRPINNVVDITNYVMLEFGQPLHAFDYNKIPNKKIVVRQSNDGEKIDTLDGETRTLESPMLVIADDAKPIALAGVMGGSNTEIDSLTTDVFLEAANFNASNTRFTRNALNISTEASYRFERYLRPELAELAFERAICLIQEIAGGIPVESHIDIYKKSDNNLDVQFKLLNLNKLLGTEFSLSEVSKIFKSLGCSIESESFDSILVTPPIWRSDIKIESDLIEEFARIYGYDNLPTAKIDAIIPDREDSAYINFRENMRDSLVYSGLNETISYAVVNLEKLSKTTDASSETFVKVKNPMDSTKDILRPNLRVNILDTLSNNRRLNQSDPIQIFEIGRVFGEFKNFSSQIMPDEKEHLIAVLSGKRNKDNLWGKTTESVDFYDAKGVLETLFESTQVSFQLSECDDIFFSKGKSAQVLVNSLHVGNVGEISDYALSHFDLNESVVMVEIFLEEILEKSEMIEPQYTRPSKFPSSERDIALLVSNDIQSDQITDVISKNPLVVDTYVIDLYEGEELGGNVKSMTFKIVFQSFDSTLSTNEIDNTQQKILKSLKHQLNIEQRY